MRALVTGAAGFIGSHLSERLLRDGWEVAGVDSFSDYYSRDLKEANLRACRENPAFRLIEADLSEVEIEPLLSETQVVFHLAAQAGVRSSWGTSFDGYLRDNVHTSQRLLEACARTGIGKLVYASSSSIYGDAEAYPTKEDVKPAPISPYGVTKLAAEHLCWLYWRRFAVPTVSLRFFTVYGPRQRPDMAFHIFCRSLIERRPIQIFGDGEQSREFTYVADVVEAVVRAADSGRAGGIYNIGGGGEITVNQVLTMLGEISGARPEVNYVSTQPGDARRTAADTSLAARDLDFRPNVGVREGLEREYAWMQDLIERSAAKP